MAKNTNQGYRIGAIKDRSQVKNPQNDHYVKRDAETGEFIEVKQSDHEPFKGVTKEHQEEVVDESTLNEVE